MSSNPTQSPSGKAGGKKPAVRGRFAPTPSGFMHIGNLYAAMIAWLHARKEGGVFVLRMEDIDKPRSRPFFAEQILSDLTWFGLDWDEGPDVGGPYGPYTQSERLERYEAALDKLERDGWLYRCYCSRAEILSAPSAPHGLASEGPAYPGTCRRLTAEEEARKARTKTPALRFRLPEAEGAAFVDGLYGPLEFPPGAGGDFIVRRADGIFAYQLAVVVDDHDMRITHVVRGADLIDSTPRQLKLYKALEMRPPSFTHVPLLVDETGERLSKRHRSLSIRQLREAGLKPETLAGALACAIRLIDRPEPLRPADLISIFDISRLPRTNVTLPAEVLRGYC